jgi:transposase
MKAYSKDLRLKVLDAVDRGINRREVVEVFGDSLPSIKRWLKMRRESGDIEPRPIPGPPAHRRFTADLSPPPTMRPYESTNLP